MLKKLSAWQPATEANITLVEWRRVKHTGRWISHSFLVAHVSTSVAVRFELFSDTGFSECEVPPAFALAGEIYDGRVATAADLDGEMTLARIRQIALEAGRREYSLESRNCHHFVREVWNAVVVESLRQRHYPDRAKTNLLRGVATQNFSHVALKPLKHLVVASAGSVNHRVERTDGVDVDEGHTY